MKLTPEQKGYLAGIIDGEGCLYYNPRKSPRKKNGAKNPRTKNLNIDGFCPVLNIANTDIRMLDYIQGLIGGTRHIVKVSPPRWKNRGVVLVHANALKELLPQIVDLLIIKKEQAKLMLKWFELFSDRRFRNFSYQRLELQNMFWKCSKALNKRGVGKPGEFRENLSNEAILSQAFREIDEKVQRLRDEAKGILGERLYNLIKNCGPISKTNLIRKSSSIDRENVDCTLAGLQLMGLVKSHKVKTSTNFATYYTHVGNSRTSAGDKNCSCSCHDIVRAIR